MLSRNDISSMDLSITLCVVISLCFSFSMISSLLQGHEELDEGNKILKNSFIVTVSSTLISENRLSNILTGKTTIHQYAITFKLSYWLEEVISEFFN